MLIAGVVFTGCMHQPSTPTPAPQAPVVAPTPTPTPETGSVASGDQMAEGNINLAASSIKWNAKKVGGAHYGTVKIKSGNLDLTDGKIVGGNFVMDMTTITVDDTTGGMAEGLLKHLKSDDFFSVANHPESTLKVTSVTQKEGTNSYDVTADLTIKGITNPVSFVVVFDAEKKMAVAPITIDRTLWDIKFRSLKFFSDIADKAIEDTVTFEVNVQLK